MDRVKLLNEKQQAKVNQMIGDSRARYIELPFDPSTCQTVKVLQGDGQVIGVIELYQAIDLTRQISRHRNTITLVQRETGKSVTIDTNEVPK